MSDLQSIQSALELAAKRRRWQHAANGLWRGLFVGAVLWVLALIIYKLAPVPFIILIGAAALAGLLTLAGFFQGWFRKPSLAETARFVDQKEKLKERLSSALELASTGGNETWRTLLVADAAKFASKLDPRKLLPYSLPQICRWTVLALALGAGLGFVPEYRSQDYLQKKQDAVAIKEAGRTLLDVTRHTLEHRPPAMPPTQKALESVQELGLKLDHSPLTRSDALKDLANVADKLKSELKQISQQNPAFKSLERSAREPSKGRQMDAAQKDSDAAQKSLGKAAENAAALEKLAADLQKAQKSMATMPKDDSPASAAARQQMAQTLSDISNQAKQLGQPLPNLDEAIAALQANQTDNFQKDMEMATTDLEKLQEMAKTLEQMRQQSDKMGKDLAEQLKWGQADAAQASLQKMIDQLKSSAVPPEVAKQMLDEVSRAINPAAPYGKCAGFLKQASQQMGNSDKSGASQSLASAAKELEKVMAQMEDAKSLQATLAACNRAEMCLAQCRNPNGAKSGRSGQKPGRGGVGTWTDDNSQLYPQMSGLWDNSGANRPDQDARGLTDRGDPQLSDNLTPTKLRGQLTPGGPMPSITLKGVSIKGQSTVAYQEAATAAQSDAQSALNQDQVPRAYQGAVRDYFDDLKK